MEASLPVKIAAGIVIAALLALFVLYLIYLGIVLYISTVPGVRVAFTKEPEKSGVLKDLPYAPTPTSQAGWNDLGMQWFTALQGLDKKIFTGTDPNRKLQPEFERAGTRFAKRILLIEADRGSAEELPKFVDSSFQQIGKYIGTQKGNEAIVYLLKATGVPIPPLLNGPFPSLQD